MLDVEDDFLAAGSKNKLIDHKQPRLKPRLLIWSGMKKRNHYAAEA